MTSAPVMAGGVSPWNANPIGNLNFTDKVVYFLDHTSNPVEGNWITLGHPFEGNRIQLPQPIKLTYDGTNHVTYDGISGSLNKEEGESYTITYPSIPPYTTHPVYLPDEKVTMSFFGESGLGGENVDIYLIKVTSDSVYGLLDALQAGDVGNLNAIFQDTVDGNYEKCSAELGPGGDLLEYDLGCLDAGQYLIVMVKQNDDESLTVLSSTAFLVTEYELCISSPSYIVKGNDLDISMTLKGASDEDDCTYGAVLIKKQAYKANIEIDSDGTIDGTSVIVNDLDVIDEFDINSSNYRSKLTKNELQTEIQTLIGEGKGAIAIGETGQNNLSLTAFDLPVGSYYLFVGAYSPEKGLVGLSQSELYIKSKGSSHKDKKEEIEISINAKIREICQNYVTNGKRIKFEFENGATPVSYVAFDPKTTAGSITTIVEELKGRSALASTDPKGEVYKHLNIQVGDEGFANSKNIENAVVGFKVNKDWITENHVNTDTIALQHFDGDKWDSLNTEKIGEDGKQIYFEAETPGFSPFAITASKDSLEMGVAGEGEQSASSGEQQGNSELVMESEMLSKENGNSVLKIASFFIGFLVIIAIGAIIKKKADSNNEGKD
ncbi:TIGR04279 domain-containing protein [Methanosarcina sp. T3]|uniref:TIGR04279 domain-containing protein n=1 Tax=Methanosarcina sp. T3 TaxID=3439062 RepID=UPI003F826FD6